MIRQLILNFEQAGLAIVLWAAVLAAIVAVVLTIVRMKRDAAPLGAALARSVGEAGIAFSLLSILIVGLWSYRIGAPRTLNLLPLAELINPPEGSSFSSSVQFVLGNVLLFLPLGLSVQLRFRNLSVGKIALGAASLAVLIEGWQWVFGTGRVTSTDDVIFNTLGAVLGALFVRGTARLYRKPPPSAGASGTARESGTTAVDGG